MNDELTPVHRVNCLLVGPRRQSACPQALWLQVSSGFRATVTWNGRSRLILEFHERGRPWVPPKNTAHGVPKLGSAAS